MISGSHANRKSHGKIRKGEVISINSNIPIFSRCSIYNPFPICWMHSLTASMLWVPPFLFEAENVSLLSFAGCHHLRRHHCHCISTIFTGESFSIILFVNFSFFSRVTMLYGVHDIRQKIPICLCLWSKCFASH